MSAVLSGKRKWLFGSEVLQRLLTTVGWGIFVLLGSYIPMPWIDPQLIAHSTSTFTAPADAGLLSLIRPPATVPLNIFMLGVEPIIEANILFALYRFFLMLELPGGGALFPKGKQFIKDMESSPTGRMTLQYRSNQLISLLAVFKAYMLARDAAAFAICAGGFFMIRTVAFYLATTFILKYISMEVEESGLGDGLTFLICLNIVAGLTTEYDRMISLGLLGLVPTSLAVVVGSVLLLLIIMTVLLSKISLKLKTQYYGDARPVEDEPVETRPVELSSFTVQNVDTDTSSDLYLTVQATPQGTQPLLTANIIAMSLPMLLSSVKACAPFVAAFQTSAAMPITIAAVAFILNLIGTYSRAVDAAKYMSSAKCRLVGIPPGTALKNGLLYLSNLMGVIGGCVLALLAWAVASIDQFAMCAYGFSPGCTGFVLLAGFVVSAIKKIEAIQARTRISDAFDKERKAIPEGMQVL